MLVDFVRSRKEGNDGEKKRERERNLPTAIIHRPFMPRSYCMLGKTSKMGYIQRRPASPDSTPPIAIQCIAVDIREAHWSQYNVKGFPHSSIKHTAVAAGLQQPCRE